MCALNNYCILKSASILLVLKKIGNYLKSTCFNNSLQSIFKGYFFNLSLIHCKLKPIKLSLMFCSLHACYILF